MHLRNPGRPKRLSGILLLSVLLVKGGDEQHSRQEGHSILRDQCLVWEGTLRKRSCQKIIERGLRSVRTLVKTISSETLIVVCIPPNGKDFAT